MKCSHYFDVLSIIVYNISLDLLQPFSQFVLLLMPFSILIMLLLMSFCLDQTFLDVLTTLSLNSFLRSWYIFSHLFDVDRSSSPLLLQPLQANLLIYSSTRFTPRFLNKNILSKHENLKFSKFESYLNKIFEK